jgi:hypothetical protein
MAKSIANPNSGAGPVFSVLSVHSVLKVFGFEWNCNALKPFNTEGTEKTGEKFRCRGLKLQSSR